MVVRNFAAGAVSAAGNLLFRMVTMNHQAINVGWAEIADIK
jgi:hypothetical protein